MNLRSFFEKSRRRPLTNLFLETTTASRHAAFEAFKSRYFLEKWRPFYTGESREFVADTIRKGTVNTELILCLAGIKPVSRFIAEKPEDIEFLSEWCAENGLSFAFRDLRSKESENNLNPRIRYVTYFSKNPDLLRIAEESDRLGGAENEITIGKLLGYPDCCNLAWSKKGEITAISDTVGFFFEEYLTSASPLNHPFFNFIDQSISFFYPCRLRCQAAKKRHEEFLRVLESEGYGNFVREILRLFALPVLLLGPRNPKALTLPLHFDEIFRIHFVGKILDKNILAYGDFFVSSLSFLDQMTDGAYPQDCLRLLDCVLSGDNVILQEDGTLTVRKGAREVASFQKEFSRASFFQTET